MPAVFDTKDGQILVARAFARATNLMVSLLRQSASTMHEVPEITAERALLDCAAAFETGCNRWLAEFRLEDLTRELPGA